MTLEGIEGLLGLVEDAVEDDPRLNGHEPQALFVMGADGAGRVLVLVPGRRAVVMARWKHDSRVAREEALTALQVRVELANG